MLGDLPVLNGKGCQNYPLGTTPTYVKRGARLTFRCKSTTSAVEQMGKEMLPLLQSESVNQKSRSKVFLGSSHSTCIHM